MNTYYQVVDATNKVVASRITLAMAKISREFVRNFMGSSARVELVTTDDKGLVTETKVVIPQEQEN